MSAITQQFPALLGVIVGAVGSYLVVTLGDRARFRREQAVRREERRQAAYSEYSIALKAVISLLYRASAQLGNDPNPHPLAYKEAKPRLGTAHEACDRAWETMAMIGSKAVVNAARKWAHVVSLMQQFVRDQKRAPEEWEELLQAQRETRGVFYRAVRSDLGLPMEHFGRWADPELPRRRRFALPRWRP